MSASAAAIPSLVAPVDPYERRAQIFPRLSDEALARARAFGTEAALAKGHVVFRRGDRTADFFIVLEGHIEIYEDTARGEQVLATHAEHQFTGELDLFNDREILVSGRMGADGRVLRFHRPQFRRLLSAEPDIAEIVMRAFILRRVGLIEHEQGGVTVFGEPRDVDALRIRRFLRRNGYPHHWIDPESDAGKAFVAEHAIESNDTAVIGDACRVLIRPGNRELATFLGLAETLDDTVHDLVVVGAGPAGLAAAVYGASEGLCTLVLETEAPGGQAGTSSKIENYLGFPTGISGQALAGRAQVQAQKFGARIAVACCVARLDCDGAPYAVVLDCGARVYARAIVIATGARYRKPALADLERYEGSGIHYAATPIEAGLCQHEPVIVVGGGNSAGQAAVFLSRHAAHVHILVRSAGLAASMSEYLISRIEASEHITLHTETELTGLHGGRHLERVTWQTRGATPQTHAISNVFLMLGAVPNTEWLDGCLALDEQGFVLGADRVQAGGRPALPLETSRPRIFAVGDARAGSIKRVASAVGEGSVVVSSVHQALALDA